MPDGRHRIEPLGRDHDRAALSCGESALDDYFKRIARQDCERGISAVFVLHETVVREVIGFYTLSAYQIDPSALPDELARKLPRRLLPATLLGRLAVDRRYQGRGYGKILLLDALFRAYVTKSEVGSVAVVVDAKNDGARAFYIHFSFHPFIDDEYRLFIIMDTIGRL